MMDVCYFEGAEKNFPVAVSGSENFHAAVVSRRWIWLTVSSQYFNQCLFMRFKLRYLAIMKHIGGLPWILTKAISRFMFQA